ncbi:MAG: orotate phosphoribosyltransferase [Patescibacteria group bacterium]
MASAEQKVARALLAIGAVGVAKEEPIQFKSGILSPVYMDNRKLISHPKEWGIVITAFADLIKKRRLALDIIAGIESAGIPHSSALAFMLKKPSVFVRKEVKGHGLKKRVEGGEVKGKRVLLIEDLVTTGGSSLSGVSALRDESAKVSDCLVIIEYGFADAAQAFRDAKVKLHRLTTFATVLNEGVTAGSMSKEAGKTVKEWLSDPWAWTKQHS